MWLLSSVVSLVEWCTIIIAVAASKQSASNRPRRAQGIFRCTEPGSSRSSTPLAVVAASSERTLWKKSTSSSGSGHDNNDSSSIGSSHPKKLTLLEQHDGPLDRDAVDQDSDDEPGPKFWPPWPFSILTDPPKDHGSGIGAGRTAAAAAEAIGNTSKKKSYQSAARIAWTFSKTSARVGVRNLQEVGSQLWFHLPPAAPPLMILASFPRRQQILSAAAAAATSAVGEQAVKSNRIVPLFSNHFARSLALSGAGLAIMSWAHSEIQRKRRLTPLPLPSRYKDVNRAVLPPFLPVEMPVFFLEEEEAQTDDARDANADADASKEEEEQEEDAAAVSVLPLALQRHWKQFSSSMTKQPKALGISSSWKATVSNYKRRRNVRQCERKNAHRLAIYDELVALQTLKQRQAAAQARQAHKNNNRGSSSSGTTNTGNDLEAAQPSTLGYALVTGASKGIGRAIAVELARWEIPLVLVARDEEALASLAYDIKTCYGVDCVVLPADLSQPRSAQNIYKTVKRAGIKVDVLVNNAGISSQGESLDLSLEQIQRMIQVNAVSVTALTHLFGCDMKRERRGRILMVSSICGAVSGIATVAVYSATKAFENSFGRSIAKELEPHGVGVTCLMPGAVSGTEFKSRSNVDEALCWKVPFYTKSAPTVAQAGVQAMLRGDPEVMPGVMNRVFMKVVRPILPQRLHNLVAETMWSPLQMPWQKKCKDDDDNSPEATRTAAVLDPDEATVGSSWLSSQVRPSIPRSFNNIPSPPRLLLLEDVVPAPEPPPVVPVVEDSVSNTEPQDSELDLDLGEEPNAKNCSVFETGQQPSSPTVHDAQSSANEQSIDKLPRSTSESQVETEAVEADASYPEPAATQQHHDEGSYPTTPDRTPVYREEEPYYSEPQPPPPNKPDFHEEKPPCSSAQPPDNPKPLPRRKEVYSTRPEQQYRGDSREEQSRRPTVSDAPKSPGRKDTRQYTKPPRKPQYLHDDRTELEMLLEQYQRDRLFRM